MNKHQLRAIYREKRQNLPIREETRLQDLLLIRFQQLPLPFIGTMHVYLPAVGKHEPDPEPLVRYLSFQTPALQVIVPKVNADGQTLSHYVLNEETQVQLNAWGIPEPVDAEPADLSAIDLVLVPLLAFDQQGHRVGYGKGFYDRFLTALPAGSLKIGLSFFEPVDRIDDTNTFDVKLDYCVTPDRLYAFE